MKEKYHFIFDFETIGQNSLECPVVCCSFLMFSWDRFLTQPYSFKELVNATRTEYVSVVDQVNNYGARYAQSDLEFWSTLPDYAQKQLQKSLKKGLTVDQFLDILYTYIDKDVVYWWSRSNTFDPVILFRYIHKLGVHQQFDRKLKFWAVRDTRTFIDAKSDFSLKNAFVPVSSNTYWEKEFKPHISSHDVAADVLRLQACVRLENDLDILEK